MNKNIALLALTGILTLASCGQNSTTPTCNTNQTLVNGVCTTNPTPGATTGVLTFVMDSTYTATVTDSSGKVVPSSSYATMTPGNYSVVFSKGGYTSSNPVNFTITAGQVTTVTAPTLSAVITTTNPPKTYYVDGTGAMQPIPASAMQNAGQNFVFYAWLQNNNAASATAGTTMADMTSGQIVNSDVAPIKSQNLAAVYVGYKAADGNTYPVVGAGVRWDIVQGTDQTNVRFAAADDGINAPGAVPLKVKPQYIGDQAMTANTFTNAASNASNAAFPSSVNYPLVNNAHLLSPNTDGTTWTALWVPNQQQGSADISVVASINGTEIDKTVLHKTFAPSAHLKITKTVDNNNAVLPGVNHTFTITVTNDGQGPANGVKLSDNLTSGTLANYSINGLSSGTANGNGGFDSSFDLAPGASQTFTFNAQGSATGQFCDTAAVTSYTNGAFGTVTPATTDGLSAQACMTVVQPQLNIIKQIANADGTIAANQSPTVPAGTQMYVKVTLANTGSADATNVNVTDALNSNTTGAPANYSVGAITASAGASAATNAGSGFTAPSQTIPVGGSYSYLVPVTASSDGKFCDTASFTSDNAGNGSSDACFTVATAHLNITKTNSVTSLNPNGTYSSTITVTNTGTADATNVNVSDVVGNNGSNYLTGGTGGSYTLTGTTQPGSVGYSGHTFTAGSVTIPAGGSMVITVPTSVPASTAPAQYCDQASFTSDNAGTGNAQACVNVSPYLPTHIQSGDSVDPLKADGTTISTITFSSFVERGANEAATNHVWNFNYGANDPANYNGAAGAFNYSNVHVIYDANPMYDTTTGIVTSDYTHGTDVTSQVNLSAASGTGLLTITAPTFQMAPGSVMYIRADVTTTQVSTSGFNSVGRWTLNGAMDGTTKVNQTAENTTTTNN